MREQVKETIDILRGLGGSIPNRAAEFLEAMSAVGLRQECEVDNLNAKVSELQANLDLATDMLAARRKECSALEGRLATVESQVPVATYGMHGRPSVDDQLEGFPKGTQLYLAAGAQHALQKVDGDMLPAIGDQVQIHLASINKWIEHTVVGYYVWCAIGPAEYNMDTAHHRVFVRVQDSKGFFNSRLLRDVIQLKAIPRANGDDGYRAGQKANRRPRFDAWMARAGYSPSGMPNGASHIAWEAYQAALDDAGVTA